MENEITWQALATVAGASVVAGMFVQFTKLFYPLTARQARGLAAILGLVTVVGVALLSGPVTTQTVVLAVVVGIQAGLAASKSYEMIDKGFGHTVERET